MVRLCLQARAVIIATMDLKQLEGIRFFSSLSRKELEKLAQVDR